MIIASSLGGSHALEMLVEAFSVGVRMAGRMYFEPQNLASQTREEREEETRLAAGVYQDNDPFAVEILYRRYYERILNYLYRRTMNRELAEDLTSQTFLKAFGALRSESRIMWFRPWLYRIATNVHLTHARSFSALGRRIGDIGRHWLRAGAKHENAGVHMEAEQVRARVRKCLDSIPEKYKSVLLLLFDEELSHSEIANALGLNSAAVRKRLERGLEMLKTSYEKANRQAGNHE